MFIFITYSGIERAFMPFDATMLSDRLSVCSDVNTSRASARKNETGREQQHERESVCGRTNARERHREREERDIESEKHKLRGRECARTRKGV